MESEVPESVAVGRGALLLVHGWCFHARRRVRRLHIVAGGERHRPIAEGMPRADVLHRLAPSLERRDNAYRSGFWALVPLPPVSEPRDIELRVEATLAGGGVASRPIRELRLEPGRAPAASPAPSGDGPRIAICMATFNPPPELFRRQVESIREQTWPDWTCLICDDDSRPDARELIAEVVGDDPRFQVETAPRRLGVYRNFERALYSVPADAELVALADQDDRWYPEKLEVLAEQLETGATLAYSDSRIVDEDGGVVSPTFWTTRSNNHTNLGRLVLVNSITGAASLFRRELLEAVLPFPPPAQDSLHDHWIGMVAMSLGKVAYMDRPLYDYVQHRGAVQGHSRSTNPRHPEGPRVEPGSEPEPLPAAREGRLRALRDRSRLRLELIDLVKRLRRNYTAVIRARFSATLLLLRGGDSIPGRKRRKLRRLARLESSPAALAWLAWLGLRSWRGSSPTLKVERMLLGGTAWRWMLSAIKRLRLPPLGPQRQTLAMALKLPLGGEPAGAARLHNLIEPLRLEVSPDAPRRVNLLIPTIDLGHFFGGYIAKFNLARKLAEAGLQVRVAAVDEPFYLPADWRRDIERFQGLEGIMDLIEVELAHDRSKPLTVSPDDRFVATTWWTAHVARHATQQLGVDRFLYLIQECEPLTFPMGSWAALARQTYDFPHYAVFSTDLLRDYFRRQGLGVFAGSDGAGDRESVAFQNAITPVRPPSPEEMRDSERKLLFYARPELHAERNAFDLALLALAEAQADGLLDGWELHGIGAQQPGEVRYGKDLRIEILERQDQSDYADLLRGHAVGLSLMLTPHPSLVPLEMAAAGMPVVTNTFENKTREALAGISPNLIAVEPTIEGIKEGIREAVGASGDFDRRLRGAAVNWSTSWEDSFTPELVERLKGFLESP
ncbi:MAG: glycosyltransferase [Actinomycetota bacterium]